MSEDVDFWIAVQIKRNAFRVAELGLRRQSFEVFGPKIERIVKRHGRPSVEHKLLFPGYLFVRLDAARPAWRSILNTHGISRIVCGAGSVPAAVPSGLIEGLQSRCSPNGLLLPPQDVVPGDRLTVSRGVLTNLVATVERIDEARRVWVLLHILGGEREVEISLQDTQRA